MTRVAVVAAVLLMAACGREAKPAASNAAVAAAERKAVADVDAARRDRAVPVEQSAAIPG